MGRAHEALYILEILAISYAGNHRKIESQRHKTNYTLVKFIYRFDPNIILLIACVFLLLILYRLP